MCFCFSLFFPSHDFVCIFVYTDNAGYLFIFLTLAGVSLFGLVHTGTMREKPAFYAQFRHTGSHTGCAICCGYQHNFNETSNAVPFALNGFHSKCWCSAFLKSMC